MSELHNIAGGWISEALFPCTVSVPRVKQSSCISKWAALPNGSTCIYGSSVFILSDCHRLKYVTCPASEKCPGTLTFASAKKGTKARGELIETRVITWVVSVSGSGSGSRDKPGWEQVLTVELSCKQDGPDKCLKMNSGEFLSGQSRLRG